MYTYLSTVSLVIRQNLERADDIANSFSATQLTSKKWLVDELCKVNTAANPRILILGGWYGSLLIPMLKDRGFANITLTDIDPETVQIASQLHDCSTFVLDADVPNQKFEVDIIVNTSCEHMTTIGDLVSSNPSCLYALQSCDNTNDPGHINTPTSTEDFVLKTNLSSILFKGRMDLGHKNRFMVIGYK